MSNNEVISKICINDLFQQTKYVIPLYQRPFAWGEKEIGQLIEDLDTVPNSSNYYYLGTLIVYKKQDNCYEVIDGQQRLTALFLLLGYLSYHEERPDCLPPNDAVTFECRNKSNTTLKNLEKIISNNALGVDEGNLEESILRGLKTIESLIAQVPDGGKQILDNLAKVYIYRVQVPPHTDLNQYFEIMNMRGEQLAQHDVLTARLMSKLSNDYQRARFAKIWDACSDMNGCVLSYFQTKDGKLSEDGKKLFADCRKQWDTNIYSFLTDAPPTVVSSNPENAKKTIQELLENFEKNNKDSEISDDNENQLDDAEEKLHSIIEFPFFLLHTLRVFKGNDSYSLDDNKLIDTFFPKKKEEASEKEWSSSDVLDFIKCLLQLRYLFDLFIIKREKDDSDDGRWSLQVETAEEHPIVAKDTLMIQACLRVAYASPSSMNWLTALMKFLYENYSSKTDEELVKELESEAENIAKADVKKWFAVDKFYMQGQGTPHIVFHYLDYILWKKCRNQSFKFTFRNSVEHWYPQHPSAEGFETWDEKDRFGNLCIMSGSVNSKFSNLPPIGKKEYKETIQKGSLKLQKMAAVTTNNDEWRKTDCKNHEWKMIIKLCDNLFGNGEEYPESLQKYCAELNKWRLSTLSSQDAPVGPNCKIQTT